MALQPGQTLLHYRLTGKIGEGGMGTVWKAQDASLDREVAIKVLPDVFSEDAERLARFEREARLLASLNHPNIAAVYGLHEEANEEINTRHTNHLYLTDAALPEELREAETTPRDRKPQEEFVFTGSWGAPATW